MKLVCKEVFRDVLYYGSLTADDFRPVFAYIHDFVSFDVYNEIESVMIDNNFFCFPTLNDDEEIRF